MKQNKFTLVLALLSLASVQSNFGWEGGEGDGEDTGITPEPREKSSQALTKEKEREAAAQRATQELTEEEREDAEKAQKNRVAAPGRVLSGYNDVQRRSEGGTKPVTETESERIAIANHRLITNRVNYPTGTKPLTETQLITARDQLQQNTEKLQALTQDKNAYITYLADNKKTPTAMNFKRQMLDYFQDINDTDAIKILQNDSRANLTTKNTKTALAEQFISDLQTRIQTEERIIEEDTETNVASNAKSINPPEPAKTTETQAEEDERVTTLKTNINSLKTTLVSFHETLAGKTITDVDYQPLVTMHNLIESLTEESYTTLLSNDPAIKRNFSQLLTNSETALSNLKIAFEKDPKVASALDTLSENITDLSKIIDDIDMLNLSNSIDAFLPKLAYYGTAFAILATIVTVTTAILLGHSTPSHH